MTTAAAMLSNGRSAMVFAEGTRSLDGRLLPFKKGPFVLAIQARGTAGAALHLRRASSGRPRGSSASGPAMSWSASASRSRPRGMTYDDRDALSGTARAAVEAMAAR